MKVSRCKRCGRPLKSQISIERGYGPTCYAKTVKEESKSDDQIKHLEPEPDDRIQHLETEIELLKKKVDAIQAMPSTPLAIPMPTSSALASIPSVNIKQNRKRPQPFPLNVGGWDVSELKENALFLKKKALADTSE